MSFERFERESLDVISEIKDQAPVEILVVHHDDADGLCSASIIKAMAEREGYAVKLLCLEKIYPEVIEAIHRKQGNIIIYADIGSAHAGFISNCNNGRNLTIILDHHNPEPASDPIVHDLNLENYGFRGEEEFSGATCTYLFSRLLNKDNVDLSYLSIVGSYEIPSGFTGLNKIVLEEAIKNNIVKSEKSRIKILKLGVNARRLFSQLQILGPVGYYENGPEIGINAALEGITEDTRRKIDELEKRRKEINRRLLARLYRERLKESTHIQWFDAGDMYKGMGSKVIGQFCSLLSYKWRLIRPDKYILGMMNLQNEVPGWGNLSGEYIKASLRVPRELKAMIDKRRALSAVDLLIRASEGFGIADGHEYAASIIFPNDKKIELLENTERVIELSMR